MKSSRSPDFVELRPDETIDRFMNGRLKLIQSKTGYRFSIDAVLLSEFVTIKPGDLMVDLGTGCGVIPLILLLTKPVGRAFGLEIQADLVDQAVRNVILNGLKKKMDIIMGDMKRPPFALRSADVVTCNPPYRKKESGRINPDPQRAIARHEIMTSLNHILTAASGLLRAKGRFAMIYPAARLADVMAGMRGFRLEPKRIRVIHPGMQSDAKLVLIEATSGGGQGLTILPPMIDQGNFSIGCPA